MPELLEYWYGKGPKWPPNFALSSQINKRFFLRLQDLQTS